MSTQTNPAVYDLAVPIEGHGDGLNHTPSAPPLTSHESMSQVIPVENQEEGMHIYFVPLQHPPASHESMSQVVPVNTSGGGGAGSGLNTEDGKKVFVKYEMAQGNSPSMMTCTSCQQQVIPSITHKPGTYAWLMGTLMFILGLTMCLYPFVVFCMFWNETMDIYHTCPHCNTVLCVVKKKCCE